MLRWHFPSDVLGGYLVAGAWISLALAVLWCGWDRWPARDTHVSLSLGVSPLFARLALIGVLFGGGFGLLLVRTRLSATYASGHASLLAGASLIALLAALLTAAVAAVTRPSSPATA
jgi:hypothetical protein